MNLRKMTLLAIIGSCIGLILNIYYTYSYISYYCTSTYDPSSGPIITNLIGCLMPLFLLLFFIALYSKQKKQ